MTDLDARPVSPRFDSPLARPMIAEWDRLVRSPTTRRRVAAWRLLEPHVLLATANPLEAVLDAVGYLGATTDSRADQLLHRLVSIAATDDLAARVCLQRVLPVLVAIARRRGPMVGGAQRAFDDVLAAAWIVIRTYPVERRPTKVAANLVRDAEYQAFVRSRRLRSAGEQIGLPDEIPARVGLTGVSIDLDPEPGEELEELLGLAQSAGFEPFDLAFLAAWARGADTRSLADSFQICERSVRNRRHQVVHRVRALALAARAA